MTLPDEDARLSIDPHPASSYSLGAKVFDSAPRLLTLALYVL
jgi:hypothetical protein